MSSSLLISRAEADSRSYIVQVKNGKDSAIIDRIQEELVEMPTRRERSCLGFAIIDTAAMRPDRVEHGSIFVRQGFIKAHGPHELNGVVKTGASFLPSEVKDWKRSPQ